MDIIETIKDQIENNKILLYMKGSPNQPQCGFSARTVQALMACGERFAYVDILANPDIRSRLVAREIRMVAPAISISKSGRQVHNKIESNLND